MTNKLENSSCICGSEMKAVDFGRECLNFSFFCYECGWGSPLRDTEEEALSAALHRTEPDTICQQLSKALCGKENATVGEMLRAVEQLKRRVGPENRVLTLEELKEHCKGGVGAEPLWIEFLEEKGLSRWVLANAPAAVFDFPLVTEWLKSKRSASDYLKRWRCWLRMPSAEEMGREKWEE